MLSKSNFTFFCAVCLAVLAFLGCRNTNSQISIAESSNVTVAKEALLIPMDSATRYSDGLRKKISVVHYYQKFGADLIWIKEGKRTVMADSMVMFIRNVSYYGLSPERYHLPELSDLEGNPSKHAVIRSELLMTDAFLCLAADLKSGLLKSNGLKTVDSLQMVLLHNVMLEGKLCEGLKSQEPTHSGYKSLKCGLASLLDSLKTKSNDSSRLADAIRLVSINLERWRNEDADFSQRHIFINIPSYTLNIVEHDTVVLSSKVIVGKPETETPMISSWVECFTTYPYWHVPRKIAIEEYLPIIQNDTTFIKRNNFDVLDKKGKILNPDSVAWHKFHKNHFPVVLRQRKGIENSLGIIKFIFDNPYAVYLHDTNAKKLFKNKDRAFSHGCIRMEKAIELAHYLMTDRVGIESKTIARYLKEKQQHWIDLKQPIPIYTRYFTCEYKNGTLYIYKDVYQKDKTLYDLLDDEPPI